MTIARRETKCSTSEAKYRNRLKLAERIRGESLSQALRDSAIFPVGVPDTEEEIAAEEGCGERRDNANYGPRRNADNP